jgi:hypothetical protein
MRLVVMCALALAATGIAHGSRGVAAQSASHVQRSPTEVVERFLTSTDRSLISYSAFRRLEAVSRGGKMQASLKARTTLDPQNGFQYEVLEEHGSGLIRSKVLRAALEAEREAKRRDQAVRGALTEANYTFTAAEITPEGWLRVTIHPRRKDTLLVEGSILLTHDEADLIRVEGLLVKRPSFWMRRVEIVRSYRRIAGVRVPIAMGSTADVLFGGKSTFSMDYEYESINGQPVTAPR